LPIPNTDFFAKLAGELGDDVPSTGLPTDEVYNRFFEALQEQKGVVIIALDEIDALVKKEGRRRVPLQSNQDQR